MKIPYFCCIGAELKRYSQDFDFMNQVYLYKVPTDDSIDEVLSEDYFKAISNSVLQDDIVYIYEASAETLHECRFDKQNGHITAVPLASDETLTGAVTSIIHDNLTPNKLLKSDENGKVAASDFSENDFVKKSGDTMTGDLAFKCSASYPTLYMHQSATTPDRLVLYKGGVSDKTIILDLAQSAILLEKLHTTKINNGYDIAVPVTNSPQTLALKSEVDLAANSGRMITDQGVWYAKMYAATVAPSAEDGTNYADFSQTDGQGNPIIVIYSRVSGAWVQSETITPPAEYDGYVPITSKIWDIPEQAGQQGGRILWNHQSKEFTPYPQIISFENAALTGTPTAPTLNAGSPSDQIVNKQTLENALANHGTGRNVGDIFYTMRNDNELNGAVECDGATYNTTDFTGAQSIGALLEAGKIDYISLTAYADAITQKGWCDKIGWNGTGNTQFRVPTLNAYIWQKLQMGVIGDGMPLGFDYNGNKAIINAHNESLGSNAGWVRAKVNSNYTSVGDLAVSTDAAQSGLLSGTSTDISQQRVMIQLAVATTDEALETCTGVLADVATLKGYDYVVDFQAPTASNNYTWYRKYKSGWIEQGGVTATNTGGSSVTLPVTMADTNYSIMATVLNVSSGQSTGGYDRCPGPSNVTTTGFWLEQPSNANYCTRWQVSGMSAS